ncbi:hypothetical protein KI387_003192 [Taxus chinensis]|uniref:Agenet domain-containing protein n=1 Tax=Taxus chinensis TaxID=29808 RepID=A0AA38LPD4_TAXCH|nr:hypothetical protein KI387_003192 [Taxus chinensis]
MEVIVGMRAETCSDDEGFRGAWFEGTVITISTHAGTCKFQYDKFVTENRAPLVEDVCVKNMRPIPPYKPLPLNCSIGDAVEARDKDCWWRGIIVKKLQSSPTATTELLSIYFPDTRTVKAYPRSALRPAQEWLGSGQKWTSSFEVL